MATSTAPKTAEKTLPPKAKEHSLSFTRTEMEALLMAATSRDGADNPNVEGGESAVLKLRKVLEPMDVEAAEAHAKVLAETEAYNREYIAGRR